MKSLETLRSLGQDPVHFRTAGLRRAALPPRAERFGPSIAIHEVSRQNAFVFRRAIQQIRHRQKCGIGVLIIRHFDLGNSEIAVIHNWRLRRRQIEISAQRYARQKPQTSQRQKRNTKNLNEPFHLLILFFHCRFICESTVSIHAIRKSTALRCWAAESGRPRGTFHHFSMQPRQHIADPCIALKTGCPRMGVCRPSLSGSAGASF